MGSIGRYIFRTTFGAFLVVLISLTAVIWITQALRDIDLLTNQGQSILVFIGITGLIIPLLVLVIAPIALFIAVSHTLNKLSTDSEIIVMNAAGISPWVLFRAFIPVTIVVSILVAATSAYFAPKGLRMLRDWLTEVKANVVSNVVQPGRFVNIESGVTMHIRARQPNGQLLGVFLDDRRNPDERITILADAGDLLENESGSFLVLRTGTVQRYQVNRRDPSFVVFDRYALDLSRFAAGPVGGEIFDPRTLPLAIDRARSERSLVDRTARTVPRRNVRPVAGAAVSAGLCRDRLRLSRAAAHHAPEPHHVATWRDRRHGLWCA